MIPEEKEKCIKIIEKDIKTRFKKYPFKKAVNKWTSKLISEYLSIYNIGVK